MEVAKTAEKIANYMIANPKKRLAVKIITDKAPSSTKRQYLNTDDFRYEINIPENDFDKLALMPVLAHESYHIKETEFYKITIDSVMKNSNSMELRELILNILEDTRINKKIYEDYPKLKRKMFALYNETLSKRRVRRNPNLVAEFINLMQCLELHFEEYAKIPDEYRKKYIPDNSWQYISFFMDKAEGIKSTDDLLPIRDCLLDCFNQKKAEAMKDFEKDIDSLEDIKKQAHKDMDKLTNKSMDLKERKKNLQDNPTNASENTSEASESPKETQKSGENENKENKNDSENKDGGENKGEDEGKSESEKLNNELDELDDKESKLNKFCKEQERMLREEIAKVIFNNKKLADSYSVKSLTQMEIDEAKAPGNGVLCSLSNLQKSKLLKEKNFDIRGKGINLKAILDKKAKLDKGSQHRIGRLNPRRLHQYKTNPNIFLSRKVDKSTTLLSILIDKSGSMCSKQTEMREVLKICFSSINRFKQQSGLKYQVIPFNDRCDISKRFRDTRIKLEYSPTGGTSIYKAFALADKHCRRLSGRRKLCVITDAEVTDGDILEMKKLSKHFYYINGLVINRDSDYRNYSEVLPFDTRFVRKDAGNQVFRKAIKEVFLRCLLR